MKSNLIQQYLTLKKSLEAEKEDLLKRLAEINGALGKAEKRPRGRPRGPQQPKTASEHRAGRHGNSASLKQLVLEATAKSPMSRQEILAAVDQAGYKFTSKNPLNSLSTLLYTAKEFKNYGGKFGPAYQN